MDSFPEQENFIFSVVHQQQKPEVQLLYDDVHEFQTGLLNVKRTVDDISDQENNIISDLQQPKPEVQFSSNDVRNQPMTNVGPKGQPEVAAFAGDNDTLRRTTLIRADEFAGSVISQALHLRHQKREGFNEA